MFRGPVVTALAVVALLGLGGCAARPRAAFQVLPATPEYLLLAPDSSRTPFGEILGRYAGAASGWVDMRPHMALRVENAYFREGAAAENISSYLGTESVRYRALGDGTLAETDAGPALATRPDGEPATRALLDESQLRHAHHRFFFQVLVNPTEDRRAAVLLSAGTHDELVGLSDGLIADPVEACRREARACTIFPASCSVSLEMEIAVNGAPTVVAWGTRLARVAGDRPGLELYRVADGRHKRVELDRADSEALLLPLLPGDRIEFPQP